MGQPTALEILNHELDEILGEQGDRCKMAKAFITGIATKYDMEAKPQTKAAEICRNIKRLQEAKLVVHRLTEEVSKTHPCAAAIMDVLNDQMPPNQVEKILTIINNENLSTAEINETFNRR